MNPDLPLLLIVALLPLVAGLLVLQTNPYHALVVRGGLGAIAALVDALLGAADVALTEALVGTMLAITLYAVAVRSSLVLRLGVVQEESSGLERLIDQLRTIMNKRYLRLEVLPYDNLPALEQALLEKEVHATCHLTAATYQTQTRISRIYDILKSELLKPEFNLTYVSIEEKKQ